MILVRRVLILLISLTFTAACASPSGPGAATQTTESSLQTSIPTQPPTQTQRAESWRSLDLRYAHVLEVFYEKLDNARVRFDVTLVHDDDGEAPQYADWWQVESPSGEVLGKRMLTHSHGTQPFTRSATIEVPAGIETVIIRGHDMLHGFGGQVIQLDLASGETDLLTELP